MKGGCAKVGSYEGGRSQRSEIGGRMAESGWRKRPKVADQVTKGLKDEGRMAETEK